MLTIIGGAYSENCLHPDKKAFFGSGLRSALAVTQFTRAHLFTYAATQELSRLQNSRRKINELTITHKERKQAIEFQYEHSGASPRLYPDYRDVVPIVPDPYKASDTNDPFDAVLAFSLIELTTLPRFSGRRVVYDPQAGHRAIPFKNTGCSAQTLAVCLNKREAIGTVQKYTTKVRATDPDTLARTILREEQADVVIVKNGIYGAHLVTRLGERATIPAFKTQRYFGIGSGDVFSATFAALWGEAHCDPVDAATTASAATAFYCSNKGALPIPPNIDEIRDDMQPIDLGRISPSGNLKRSNLKPVYLAGPFFTIAQKWLINVAHQSLESAGLRVWSPSSEAGILPYHAKPEDISRIVKRDLMALDSECGSVFAIADGLDPGTLFEIGYAASKKNYPVTVFAQHVGPGDLTMMIGSGCEIVDDLASAVHVAAWKALRL